jgi:hypothetical protein
MSGCYGKPPYISRMVYLKPILRIANCRLGKPRRIIAMYSDIYLLSHNWLVDFDSIASNLLLPVVCSVVMCLAP